MVLEGFEHPKNLRVVKGFNMSRVLKELFADHYVALAVLSVSWLGVYCVFRIGDWIATKLLLRVPFYMWIRLKRQLIGLAKVQERLLTSGQTLDLDPEKLATKVGRFYSSIDKEFSKIRGGERAISFLLRSDSIQSELRHIADTDWALLESDFAFCEAISHDVETSTRGIISFVGNPRVKAPEATRLLFYRLRQWPNFEPPNKPATLPTVLFHIGKVIESKKQLEELQGIVSDWPEPQRSSARRTAREIEDRLSRESVLALPAVVS
jgi:hypothetical protein